MLFNTEEKSMMVGALTAGGLSAVLDGYFGYRLGGGTNISTTPSDPLYWLYANFAGYWVPNLSQLIPWFAVPGLLLYMGKRKRNAKYKNMGYGGLVYGVAGFVAATAFKITAYSQGAFSYSVVGVVR